MSTPLSPYRFCGTLAIIYNGDELTQFGQRTMQSTEDAESLLAGGCIMLPEPDFFKFFTPQQVASKTFPKFPGQWVSAPTDLQAARKAAVTEAVTRHYAASARAKAAEAARIAAAPAKAKADADLAAAQAEEIAAAKLAVPAAPVPAAAKP